MMRNKVDKKSEHVRVFVRARPLQEGEARAPIQLDTMRKEVLAKTKTSRGQTSYTFNKVFDTETEQVELFDTACKPLVSEMLKGFSCTIFAYGQTNSGKTHSMMGDLTNERLQGLTPRACKHIFNELLKNDSQFTVRLSCVELYKEEFYDMLVNSDQPKQKLKLFQDGQKGVVMKGVEEVVVTSPRDVMENLEGAMAKRQTAATGMNNRSSRSHFIATISVTIKEETMNGEQLFKMGKLHLVDLAGSESAKRTDSVGTERQSEAAAINKSLLTLGRVISSLSNPSLHSHTPYRESALTRLLQDALGGRSKTSIITTISLARSNLDETLSTLEYASSARKIENDPEMNRTLSGNQLVSDYETELMRLRSELVDQRNGTGVFISEERYAMMQTRLKELEEDHVFKDEKLNQMQVNLQECAEEMHRIAERNNHKNILLEHHQDVENSLIDAIDESQLREDGLRAAMKKRDHTEQKNLNIVAETSEAIAASCNDVRDALRSATDSVSVINSSVQDVTQKVSVALCEKSKTVADLLDKQSQLGQNFYQCVNDLVATNTQHGSQIMNQVIDLSVTSSQEASSRVTELANTVTQSSGGISSEHEATLKSGLSELFTQFLAASQQTSSSQSTASKAAVKEVLETLQQSVLSSVKDLSVGVSSDLLQNRNNTQHHLTAHSDAISSQCGTVSAQINEATTETITQAEAAHQKLTTDTTAIAETTRGTIQQVVENYNTKMMCFQSRTNAAVQSSVEEKQRLQSELQKLIAEYDVKNAQITTTLNDTLSAIESDRQQETQSFYEQLSAAQDNQNHSVKESVSCTTSALSATFENLTRNMNTIQTGVSNINTTTSLCSKETSERMTQETDALNQYIDTCQQSMHQQSTSVMEVGYGKTSELFDGQAQETAEMSNKMKVAVEDVVRGGIQSLAASMSQMSTKATETSAEITSSLSSKAEEIKSGQSHFTAAQQTLQNGLQSGGRATLNEVSEATVEGKGVLSNTNDIMSQYVSNMKDGMASGTGEIMSGINATEAIVCRLRENSQYLTEGVRQHKRGGTPSPRQVYLENTHSYDEVIDHCTDDQVMDACETPAAQPRAVGQYIEDHPPMYIQPSATPVKQQQQQGQYFDPHVGTYTPGGQKTPKTPLAVRPGNIMCE